MCLLVEIYADMQHATTVVRVAGTIRRLQRERPHAERSHARVYLVYDIVPTRSGLHVG